MPGLLQLVERCRRGRIALLFEAQIDKEPIGAVNLGLAQRLAVDRDQPLALFPGQFRDELLRPRAEIGDARARRGVTLSRPCMRSDAQRVPSRTPGFSAGGTSGPHERTIVRRIEQVREIDARGRGRHQSETETAPNSARRCSDAEEDAAEVLLFGDVCSSAEPGSVMATKCWPAFSRPIASAARAKK